MLSENCESHEAAKEWEDDVKRMARLLPQRHATIFRAWATEARKSDAGLALRLGMSVPRLIAVIAHCLEVIRASLKRSDD